MRYTMAPEHGAAGATEREMQASCRPVVSPATTVYSWRWLRDTAVADVAQADSEAISWRGRTQLGASGDRHTNEGFHGRLDVDAQPIIVCGVEHRFTTEEQMDPCNVEATIVVEPVRHDTALAALEVVKDGQDAIMVAMPANHSIADYPALHHVISVAARYAQCGTGFS
jgi:hypothetical protein